MAVKTLTREESGQLKDCELPANSNCKKENNTRKTQ